MNYSFFWLDECGSYSLYLKFASINDAKNFARALALSQSVTSYGVEVYTEEEGDNVRVYGVRSYEGDIFEF